MTGPPIEDGAVRIEGDRITEAGRCRDLCGEAEDLGDVILMPGLVNAHCHLDYTDLAGRIPPPDSFNNWITGIVNAKNGWDDEEWKQSWLNGARQCLRHGITTVGNIETRSDLLPALWPQTDLRLLSFLEVIVVRPTSNAEKVVGDAVEFLKTNSPRHGSVGLSPHSPYTVRPDALRECVKAADENQWPITMHLAESADEQSMFRDGDGPLHQRLSVAGREMTDCDGRSPVAHAAKHRALNDRLLAVHGNYLDDNDIEILANNRVSMVHCPRSHAYFGHTAFRHWALRKAGVNVCLGTDSLATIKEANADLDLFAEMRAFKESNLTVATEAIVRMATIDGARALGWEGLVGELSEGAFADLAVLPWDGANVFEEIVNYTELPCGVMVGGKWVAPATQVA